jgi:hypothetical protein
VVKPAAPDPAPEPTTPEPTTPDTTATTEAPEPEAPVAEEHASQAAPVIAPDDTPMSIPDNETVTIIQP